MYCTETNSTNTKYIYFLCVKKSIKSVSYTALSYVVQYCPLASSLCTSCWCLAGVAVDRRLYQSQGVYHTPWKCGNPFEVFSEE